MSGANEREEPENNDTSFKLFAQNSNKDKHSYLPDETTKPINSSSPLGSWKSTTSDLKSSLLKKFKKNSSKILTNVIGETTKHSETVAETANESMKDSESRFETKISLSSAPDSGDVSMEPASNTVNKEIMKPVKNDESSIKPPSGSFSSMKYKHRQNILDIAKDNMDRHYPIPAAISESAVDSSQINDTPTPSNTKDIISDPQDVSKPKDEIESKVASMDPLFEKKSQSTSNISQNFGEKIASEKTSKKITTQNEEKIITKKSENKGEKTPSTSKPAPKLPTSKKIDSSGEIDSSGNNYERSGDAIKSKASSTKISTDIDHEATANTTSNVESKQEKHTNTSTNTNISNKDHSERKGNITHSSTTERDAKTYNDSTSGIPARGAAGGGGGGGGYINDKGLLRGQHFSRDSRQTLDIGVNIGSIGGSGSTSNRETTSFLETLTEEEKRTRTRHLPDVEGFRRLHKSEIKSDLKVARSHHSFQPELFSKQPSKMDKKGEFSSLESSKANSSNKYLIDIIPDDEEYYNAEGPVPTDKILNPFIAPETVSKSNRNTSITDSISSSGEGDDSLSSGTGLKHQNSRNSNSAENRALLSPKVINSIKAFNPPRPPESIGPKKKNRLLRWERNPHEVEIDLDNYRKTVERTQEELQNAESERVRVETLGSTLRDHFMNHLRLIREESVIVNREFQLLQAECTKTINSMMNGARKNQCTKMSDVLSVLSDEAMLQSLETQGFPETTLISPENTPGIGGISFDDGKRFFQPKDDDERFPRTIEKSVPIASGWILPGNKVRTAYGDGVVVEAIGVSFFEDDPRNDLSLGLSSKTPSRDLHGASNADGSSASVPKSSKNSSSGGSVLSMKKNHRHGHKKFLMGKQTSGSANNSSSDANPFEKESVKQISPLSRIIPPRICVRLEFGVGYFPPNHVTVIDDFTTLSNDDLVSRWKRMTESAYLMKDCVDNNALEDKYLCTGMRRKIGKAKISDKPKSSHNQDAEHDYMDTDEKDVEQNKQYAHDEAKINANSEFFAHQKPAQDSNRRVVPFDGGMIAVSGWSGSALTKIPFNDLEQALHPILCNGSGVLGKESNTFLNDEMKFWEKQRFDLFQLQADVLQLRNELCRQEKARKLNERSREAAEERARKVENLFIEMKADLNSLKERLRDELSELGIGQGKAEEILANYSRELNDVVTDDENSLPQKRGRDSDSGSTGVSSRNTRRKNEDDIATKTNSTKDDDLMDF